MAGLESPAAGAGGARQIPEWNGILSEVRQRQPAEGPDPFGAYDADWEWQGRYLELEQKLLAQARKQRRTYFESRSAYRSAKTLLSYLRPSIGTNGASDLETFKGWKPRGKRDHNGSADSTAEMPRPEFEHNPEAVQARLTREQHTESRQCAELNQRSRRKTRSANSSRRRAQPRATKRRSAGSQRRAR